MHIFISHSSADISIAMELCTFIEKNHSTCFIAPRDIRSGKEYAEEIINGINNADAMILLMSKNANSSPHVLREVERAVSRSIPILVYKLEDVELSKSLEYFLMTHQWIVAEKKYDFSKILKYINEYEKDNVENPNSTPGTTDKTDNSSVNIKKSTNKRKKGIIFIICAVFLLFVILAILFIINKKSYTPQYALGDTVTFGSYLNEPIEWRILNLSENGKEAILISTDIITMKAYDVAESGTYNSYNNNEYWSESKFAETDYSTQIQIRGNNDWSTSNIRTWLNSEKEVVEYTGTPPYLNAMSEGHNGYHNEPGFLSNFSTEEIDAILYTELQTSANSLSNEEYITTSDRVFLLSKDELVWFEDADMSLYTSPTLVAVEQDTSNWYDVDVSTYNIKEYYWWLREPVEDSTCQCYMVSNGYNSDVIVKYYVGTEGFGIRPAIRVDLSSDCFK